VQVRSPKCTPSRFSLSERACQWFSVPSPSASLFPGQSYILIKLVCQSVRLYLTLSYPGGKNKDVIKWAGKLHMGGMDRGGGGDRWVRRRETIGQRINNTVMCPVPSPFDSKRRCLGWGGGGRMGRGPLVETYFFTLRNGALWLLWASFFFFWKF
jgi:hypothetical protein